MARPSIGFTTKVMPAASTAARIASDPSAGGFS